MTDLELHDNLRGDVHDGDVVLGDAFRYARSFYPSWDPDAAWRAVAGFRSDETDEEGYCDTEPQIIYVRPDIVDLGGDYLALVLIHEIGHALHGPEHRERFQDEMRRAAAAAERGGALGLAELLRQEADSYQDNPTLKADDIYGTLEDLVRDAPVVPTLEQAVKEVARFYGTTTGELNSQYPLLRERYDEAVEFRALCEMNRFRTDRAPI